MGFGELGHAGQGAFEKPALGAGTHHADCHLAEDLRILAHGVGQRGPVLDLPVNLAEDFAQRGMRGLLAKHVQRAQQGDAAAQKV